MKLTIEIDDRLYDDAVDKAGDSLHQLIAKWVAEGLASFDKESAVDEEQVNAAVRSKIREIQREKTRVFSDLPGLPNDLYWAAKVGGIYLVGVQGETYSRTLVALAGKDFNASDAMINLLKEQAELLAKTAEAYIGLAAQFKNDD